MKSIVCNAFGGPQGLVLTERPAVIADPGEVLIAVEAAGVGYVDTMARKGRYPLDRSADAYDVIVDTVGGSAIGRLHRQASSKRTLHPVRRRGWNAVS